MFEGAKTSLYNMNWDITESELSTDEELKRNDTLVNLRIRSSQLIKDNPIAAGAQIAYVNTIGVPSKIEIVSKNRIQKQQLDSLLDDYLKGCDITGTESISNIIEQIVSWSFAHGDILINLPMDKKREGIQTVVELIEASRIATPTDQEKDPFTKLGVKYDPEGHILGYWVKNADAMDKYGDDSKFYTFFPLFKESNGLKRRVTYLFKAPLNPRPKTSRQYPILTPIITRFKFLKDYEEAVLVGARVAACFSAFVLSDNPAAAQKSMEGSSDPEGGARKQTKLQPGLITYLRRGVQDIKFASPNLPGDNVDDFRVREYKQIAMYLRIPYQLLFLDLSETSYSSWKGGVLESKRNVTRWRRNLNDLIDWFVGTVILEATLNGLARGSIKDVTIKKRWPSAGILDPEKEARGNKLRIDTKVASPQMICDEEGNDYEEIQEEIKQNALLEVEREAEILKLKKEYEEKYDIVFDTTLAAPGSEQNRMTKRRPGEKQGKDLDPDDAKERRKNDGNW